MHAPEIATAMRTARVVRAIALPGRELARQRNVYVAPAERVHAIAWWEYESEAKRCYTLEIVLRTMFAVVPPKRELD